MESNWSNFKTFITSRSLSIQWVIVGTNYYLKAFDSAFTLECMIPVDNAISSDTVDFETNFKVAGNKSPSQLVQVQATPPFGSKTITVNGVTKNLYARFTGLQFTVDTGANTLTYTATYPWAKMLGIECIGGVTGDTADLKIYDTPAGTYSGVPNLLLNQFAYMMNVAPNFYGRMAQFDADLYQGMVIKITYTVCTPLVSNRFFGINLLMNEVK